MNEEKEKGIGIEAFVKDLAKAGTKYMEYSGDERKTG